MLCNDLGSAHKVYFSIRVFELRNELLKFFTEKNHNFKNYLVNMEFLSRLAYLPDISVTLNHMTLLFQGPNSNIIDFVSKLQVYVWKLDLWKMNIEAKQYQIFTHFFSLQKQPNEMLLKKLAAIYKTA